MKSIFGTDWTRLDFFSAYVDTFIVDLSVPVRSCEPFNVSMILASQSGGVLAVWQPTMNRLNFDTLLRAGDTPVSNFTSVAKINSTFIAYTDTYINSIYASSVSDLGSTVEIALNCEVRYSDRFPIHSNRVPC